LLHPLFSLNLKGVAVGNKVNLIPSSSVPRHPILDSVVQLWGRIRRKEDFDNIVPPLGLSQLCWHNFRIIGAFFGELE